MEKDQIYKTPLETVAQFAFDDKVAEVFDDMAYRSIPLYKELMEFSARASKQWYQADSNIYDLGCSTGNTIVAIRQLLPNASIIGVDYSAAMIEKCRAKLASLGLDAKLSTISLENVRLESASVVFLNYVLQFIEPENRSKILKQIYNGMLPGAILIMSEKVKQNESLPDEVVTASYYDFKRKLGYSDLEISQKRQALENYLRPLEVQENIRLLSEAGFKAVEVIQKLHSFLTLLAVK